MIKRFLLVDDDIDDKTLFKEALSEVDATISYDTAEDGREALSKLEASKNALPDIILLDINMPGMDGWQCLKQLKKDDRYKDIPVVMHSTSSSKMDAMYAGKMGAICFFTKPDNYTRIKEIISTLLHYAREGRLADVGEAINGLAAS